MFIHFKFQVNESAKSQLPRFLLLDFFFAESEVQLQHQQIKPPSNQHYKKGELVLTNKRLKLMDSVVECSGCDNFVVDRL